MYRFGAEGRIDADFIAHLENEPEVLMYGTDVAHVRDGMICTLMSPEDFTGLRFTVNGAAAPTEAFDQVRDLLREALAGVDELCSRLAPGNDVIQVSVYADGVEQPDLAHTMIWVRPEDGYPPGSAGLRDGT
jgi:hypothetical protein